jgi:hypothetical protein
MLSLIWRCVEVRRSMNDLDRRIISTWLKILVNQIDGKEGKSSAVDLKLCAGAHYSAIRMEDTIRDLKGDLPRFIDFLESKMNWIIRHDEGARTILADENKPDCVCPLYKEGLLNEAALCECSRGFAEQMFGYILGTKVEASIVESILRRGTHCVYKIAY